MVIVLSSCGEWQEPLSLAELKAKVLSRACNSEVRKVYERRIGEQSVILTETQLRRSLENMIEDMKCQ